MGILPSHTMDLVIRATNATASSSNVNAPGQGITGGYEGNSLTIKVCIAFFLGLAMYNVLELLVLIFGTFSKFSGLYFWSLVISALGIIPYSLGFLFKYFSILTGPSRWGSVVLLTIGWYPMVRLISIQSICSELTFKGDWSSYSPVVSTTSRGRRRPR